MNQQPKDYAEPVTSRYYDDDPSYITVGVWCLIALLGSIYLPILTLIALAIAKSWEKECERS